MFSYELTTNPWMYYTLYFPDPDYYASSMGGWYGKSEVYWPYHSVMYEGWCGAILDALHVRTKFFGVYDAK